MVQNIILMNESQKVRGLRNLLAAAVCQTSAAGKNIKSRNIGRNVKTRQCLKHHFQLASHLPNLLKCICAKHFQIFATVKS